MANRSVKIVVKMMILKIVSFVSIFVLASCKSVPLEGDDGSKIIGGSPIDIARVPYQVSLKHRNSHICGASIISEQFILTAAHCFGMGVNQLSFTAGSSKSTGEGTSYRVAEAIPHPKYKDPSNPNIYDYDVGICRSATPIKFSSTIKPMKMADYGINVPTGQNMLIAGWGYTQEGSGQVSPDLLHAIVRRVDQKECNDIYSPMNVPITSRMLCTGEPGHSTCQGDSGGGLIYNSPNGPVVVGVVSWANGCAQPGYPTVFGFIGDREMRSFIKSVTGL